MGSADARGDGTLTVADAAGIDGKNKIVYRLHSAWCQELTVTGIKAGDTSVATIEVKIACNKIEVVGG